MAAVAVCDLDHDYDGVDDAASRADTAHCVIVSERSIDPEACVSADRKDFQGPDERYDRSDDDPRGSRLKTKSWHASIWYVIGSWKLCRQQTGRNSREQSVRRKVLQS